MRPVRRALPITLLLALAGCGDAPADPAATQPQVVDSAGIRIVTHLPGTLRGDVGGEWAGAPDFSGDPEVRIGVLQGDEAHQFTDPVGGAVLSDGRIVVLDRASRTLRFYDARGAHLRSVGTEGDGPGEFRVPSSLHHLPGDTLVVLDLGQQRVHWFGPTGELVRDASADALEIPGRVASFTAAGVDGAALTAAVLPTSAEGLPASGRMRETVGLFTVATRPDPDGPGSRWRTLPVAEFDGEEREIFVTTSGGQISSIEVRTFWFFRRFLRASGPGGGLWTAAGVDDEIMLRGAALGAVGSRQPLGMIVRFEGSRPVLDAATIAMIEEADLERFDDPAVRAELRRANQRLEYPPLLPAIGSLFSDQDGRPWVGPLEIPIRRLPSGMGMAQEQWIVLDVDGTSLGSVRLPPASRPLWASERGLLMVRVGDLDVPRIEWWPARGSAGGAAGEAGREGPRG